MDIRELATSATEEVVTSHTVGIISETKDGPRTGIGTGTAIEWRGRRMILTAAHVVRTADPSQLRFLFRPEGAIQREYVESRTPTGRFFRAEEIEVRGMRSLDPLDLAVIDVSSDLDANHPVTFFPLDSVATAPSPGTVVMIIGLPSALGQRVYGGQFAASRAIAYERVQEPTSLSAVDPDAEFAVTYTYGEDVGPDGIHPGGFSGAGIWSYQETDSLIWHARVALGGMLTAYFPTRRLATGLRVETIVRALNEDPGV